MKLIKKIIAYYKSDEYLEIKKMALKAHFQIRYSGNNQFIPLL